MLKEPKHHYIPEFYLNQWVGENRVRGGGGAANRSWWDWLCSWTLSAAGRSAWRRVCGRNRADVRYRYVGFKGVGPHDDGWHGSRHNRSPHGARWCQFLYSLIVRNPEPLGRIKEKLKSLDALQVLENIREDYPKLRSPEDPETFDEYKAAFVLNPIEVPATRVLPVLLKSKRVMAVLASLQWRIATVNTAKYPLLTSDRPVIMSNGLSRPDTHIVLPISPRRLFIATKDEQTFQDIISGSMNLLAQTVNNQVAQQANRFVYSVDDKPLRFVAKRLGKRVWSSPLD